MRYHRPSSLAEALAIRREHDVTVLAGGTDVYPAHASRRAWGDPSHPDVLDISGIASLRGIADRGDHWRIGALATWTDLIRADLPPLLDGLRRAARAVGGVQIQNRGTLVGNACTASPAGDGIPNLLALDAAFEVSGARVPAERFFTGYRTTAAGPRDLVTAILIPKAPGRGHFVKLGARRYLVISIAMAAAVVETDAEQRIARARIAVGACGAVARRLPDLEAALRGVALARAPGLVHAQHLAGLAPIDDVRASAAYRMAAARALVADCLAALADPPARRAA
ncbi:Carbon monoxide dehydrogenase medium chain [Methylobacterium crusticola]|uniref:Carbon monoxide dehydrogenase medium chain n=1 Tax=Methylobacterium crusticola TaxID=1697972 RepID=A0ABQ4R599_9HYPH|nr:FAD binding domain-containing protein [Methylobacterium crusticola]GJD52861.1 Carbon monoxide dehydrogenase medium chain [Methylobacterium crusticola]